jgi:membrane-bound lytic murein transglycosylase B
MFSIALEHSFKPEVCTVAAVIAVRLGKSDRISHLGWSILSEGYDRVVTRTSQDRWGSQVAFGGRRSVTVSKQPRDLFGADLASRRERRITAAIVVTAVSAVGALPAAAAVFAAPAEESRAAPEPSTTMEAVMPSAEPVAPAAMVPPLPTSGPAAASAPEVPAAPGGRIDPVWVSDMSARTGIGAVALQAYGLASIRLRDERPSCHLGWTTLAGVGAIESGHGTSHGASLQANGTTTIAILGPALDGSSGMARIPSDEQSMKWHGDERWDHAVGPMQFIPSTWRKWGSDGDGDGEPNPNNAFDAAYAAARYLCASGADLATHDGWTRAIYSYNHSDAYVRKVLARANAYVAA